MKAKLFKSFSKKAEACDYVRNHQESLVVVKREGKFLAVLPQDKAGKLKYYSEKTTEAAKRCRLHPTNYLFAKKHLSEILKLKKEEKNLHEIARALGTEWSKIRQIYKRYKQGMLEELT